MSAIQQLLASYGAFNPLTIPSLTEWFDYRTLASVGNGNPIGSWAGNKGLYTLAQSGTARPTYAADDGDGRGAAQFDGVNDELAKNPISNAALFGTSGDAEVWAVVKLDYFQTYGAGGVFYSTFITNQIGVNITGSLVVWAFPTGAQQVFGPASLLDNTWHVLRLGKSGASRIIQVDGTTIYHATTAAGTYNVGDDALFVGNNGGYFMNGSLRHLMMFNAPLDDVTAAQLNSYLPTA